MFFLVSCAFCLGTLPCSALVDGALTLTNSNERLHSSEAIQNNVKAFNKETKCCLRDDISKCLFLI